VTANTEMTVAEIKIIHDGVLTIATGRSRNETNWKNKEMLWSDLVKRLSNTTRTAETYSEYIKMSKTEQGNVKDVGGFIGGALKGGRRKADAVVWRQIITLDADFIKGDLWSAVETMFDFGCLAYSTHKHSSVNPRLRLVIPLSRPITPDEYQAVSRKIASYIGIDFFDDTSYQPHRLMYFPSTAQDGDFFFDFQDEPWLNPDDVLSSYPDWKDPSYWPESSRLQQARQRLADKQGDPHEKPGVIGAFCRAYSISEAIETFLEGVYEPAGDDRFTYLEGSTNGGLITYEEKFAYSHHGTDPVGGQLVNAFDLVRIHKFGLHDEDSKQGTPVNKLPSFVEMTELVNQDSRVKRQRITEDFGDAERFQESGLDWLEELEAKPIGKGFLANAHNVDLILKNDPALAGKFARDVFSYRDLLLSSVPWRTISKPQALKDADDAGLRNFLSKEYGIPRNPVIGDALSEYLISQEFHPVQDYLKGLQWDGVNRVETLLIDYLGAEDNELTRAMTRLTLTGAVARVFRPGCKFDYVLTLIGKQGIGKSSLLALLAGDWFTDSLEDVRGKDAYEQIQGSWIVELGELAALRKADVEAIKRFVSAQVDKFRQSYSKRSEEFPRQCIFIATTNDEEPLKDQTGNRRFWPVSVGVQPIDLSKRKDFPRDQIWAEAVELFKKGVPLTLPKHLEEQANDRQKTFTEESIYAGQIREGLDKPFEHGDKNMFNSEVRDRVCAREIWKELLGFSEDKFTSAKGREINGIMKNTPGWRIYPKNNGRTRHGEYGNQTVFERVTDVTD
jgi:putative DNA primase/helicase